MTNTIDLVDTAPGNIVSWLGSKDSLLVVSIVKEQDDYTLFMFNLKRVVLKYIPNRTINWTFKKVA